MPCIEPVETQHTAISSQGFFRNRILIGGLILYGCSFAVVLRNKNFDPTGAVIVLVLFGGLFPFLAWIATRRALPLSVSVRPSTSELIVLTGYIIALSLYLIGGPQWIDQHLPSFWIDSLRIKFFVSLAKKLVVFVAIPFAIFRFGFGYRIRDFGIDNWQTTVIGGIITGNQVSAIQTSGHAPTQPSESAIIADLPPGNYTAIVRGKNIIVGVALVEVYDLSPGTTSPSILANISTRSFVQTGDNVMIGGFIVQGAGSKRVIVHAIGPELGAPPYDIPNALANPTLELHDGTGALIASNDDWQTTIIGGIITADQVSAIQNSGHVPTQPSESAIIANLLPGSYTGIARGKNIITGVDLVEVHDLD